MNDEKNTQLAVMNPSQMIQAALQSAIDNKQGLEVVSSLLEQRKWALQREDEENFNAALRRIQDRLKPIAKKGWNEQTKSRYATAESIDDIIEGQLQQENMALSFEPESHPDPHMICVVGVLSLGAYSRRYPLPMPTDGQGPKGGGVMSRTHATGSAITYAKRYLKNMIFNLRFQEKDDDGNGAGGKQLGSVSEHDYIRHIDNISNANNAEELKKSYLSAQSAADATGDTKSTLKFSEAKNKRWNQLKQEGKV